MKEKIKAFLRTLKTKAKDVFTAIKQKKNKIALRLTVSAMSALALAVPAFAAEGGDAGVEQFETVIDFFATWIGRIGLIVGFVGGIMFALAIKNDDADAKTRGLMTLAAGFVVFALTQAVDMFL